MRHRKANKKFDRPANQRKALLRGLINNLITHGKIETTMAKAKALRPSVEKIITLGRKDSQANRRLAFSKLVLKTTVAKLFDEIGPRYKDRHGGYTRILKLGMRVGDASELAIIELV
jgi:large subunit ribosomal protein L17